VTRDVTLSATNPATIDWQTKQPYESTVVVCRGARLRMENVIVRHSSPSVANNYAIFCQEGAFEAVNCDFSSTTGSGVGMEGGSVSLSDCRIQGCKGSGAVLAGALSTADAGFDEDSSQVPKVCPLFCIAHLLKPSCPIQATMSLNLMSLMAFDKGMHVCNA
jgi:hypothetical protein